MPRKLIIRQSDGSAPVLEEVTAADEAQLQEQMKQQPELLPLEEVGVSGPLLVVGRESPLPSGRIDLVALASGGELLLIEFKTGPSNPDFRAVLAQLIDYGSDLWGMTVEQFESSIALPYFKSEQCPPGSFAHGAGSLDEAATAAWGDAQEAPAWREHLAGQLHSGDFTYLVVAQRFSPPVLRSIRYINDKVRGPRFYAIEMIKFGSASAGLAAYEARRVQGPQAPSSSSATALQGVDELLDKIEDDDYRVALEQFFEAVVALKVVIYLGTSGVSLRVSVSGKPDLVSIGWIFPPGPPRWMGLTNVTLGYYQGEYEPTLASALTEFVSSLSTVPGAEKVTKGALDAYTFEPTSFTNGATRLVGEMKKAVEALGSS